MQISLQKCNMLCSYPQLWPRPKRILQAKRKYIPFHIQQFDIRVNVREYLTTQMLKKAYRQFRKNIAALIHEPSIRMTNIDKFVIIIMIEEDQINTLTLDTEESYILSINRDRAGIIAHITANNFFGARHALETLSQLIWFDNVDRSLNVIHEIEIRDKPSFTYRGLMVDTARNYFPVNLLIKLIDGMAANKLNIFHWHLTDSHSFPFVAPSYPKLGKYGSYQPNMVYNDVDIKYIIEYAKPYGIRVLIEIDAPSHILSGWNAINSSTKLILSDDANINGQLNPENPETLNILEKLYTDILQLTGDDLFHIGGDEIDLDMWMNLVPMSKFDAIGYWVSYIRKMIATLQRANNNKHVKNVIMWSNKLLNSYRIKRLFNENITMIIQYWYGRLNMRVIQKYGLKLIFSNTNSWYLDCGFGAWQERKTPNCEPYRTWQHIYKATPWYAVVDMKSVLGGEVCMWTEQVGQDSLETRVWPRSSAFAERMWSNPDTDENVISSHVYTRLDTQVDRMSSRNIKSEVLWPRYCTLNPGKC